MKLTVPSVRYKARTFDPVIETLAVGTSNRNDKVLIATHEVYISDLIKAIEQVNDTSITRYLTQAQRDAIYEEKLVEIQRKPKLPDTFTESVS